MAEATVESLAVRVRRALCDRSTSLWLPELTADLADGAWHMLTRDLGLTQTSYGTARVLCQNSTEVRQVAVTLDTTLINGGGVECIPVEVLPEALARRYAGPHVRFFGEEEIPQDNVLGQVEEALEILGTVPTVLPTICSLIRALHLIDPVDHEVDISFSEPNLPFSAFVSVPGSGAVAGALRVAEALIHEAMHLQLTLVEIGVPLVVPTERTYFSPWRNEFRTAQGVLHALYVFRVVDAFLEAALLKGRSLTASRRHARERRAMIAHQVRGIHNFSACPDLTAEGAAFVERLLGD